jgi:hypothetical protein
MFVREIFVINGWEETTLNGRAHGTPMLYQGHCEKASQCVQAMELALSMPLIMPLRHPFRVEESWKRRGESAKRMMRAYINMLDSLRSFVSVWVPIDGDPIRRHQAHARLSKEAGKTLVIDWDTVINSKHGTHHVDLKTLDPSDDVRDLMRDPLMADYYGETSI